MVDVILAKNIRVWVAVVVHGMRERDAIICIKRKKKNKGRRIEKEVRMGST